MTSLSRLDSTGQLARLEPRPRPAQVAGQRAKTRVVKRSLNPVWGETFSLAVADHCDRLTAAVFDWDFAAAHDFMGAVAVSVSDLIDQARAPPPPSPLPPTHPPTGPCAAFRRCVGRCARAYWA